MPSLSSGLNLLIVEDEEEVAERLVRAAQESGIFQKIQHFRDYAGAAAAVTKEKYDAIIMDGRFLEYPKDPEPQNLAFQLIEDIRTGAGSRNPKAVIIPHSSSPEAFREAVERGHLASHWVDGSLVTTDFIAKEDSSEEKAVGLAVQKLREAGVLAGEVANAKVAAAAAPLGKTNA